MPVAIISDIHDNIPNLKKVLTYCAANNIQKIICCGDLASLETLDFLNDNFQGEIFYTFGNMDNAFLKNYPFENNQYKKTKIFKEFGEVEIDNKRVAFIHFPQEAAELCQTGKYEFVFYGHTHKPWSSEALAEETPGLKKCIMLNPGNVANQFYPPTFAIWNTSDNMFELIRINNLQV